MAEIQQQSGDLKKIGANKMQANDFAMAHHAHHHHMGITRERSFIRPSNHQQNAAKRRSLALQQQQQQIRTKPALEIYRPPNVRMDNKLNVHAQEFQMHRQAELQNSRSSITIYPSAASSLLQHSKSSGNMHQQQHQQQQQLLAVRHHAAAAAAAAAGGGGPRAILVSHPLQMGQMSVGVSTMPSSQMPLVNSPSSGNILQSSHRVKFAPEPQHQQQPQPQQAVVHRHQLIGVQSSIPNQLQRSKSLSSADAITRGLAGLGLGVGNESSDLGLFPPELQSLIDKAADDPNQLNARCLMELANHLMQRAVEGRRYALPISRMCISIVAKERKETFLEALLNTCRQWYQERDKVLGAPANSKVPMRPRFTAFMAFLTEMFCQLKRRQLQLRTQCDGVPPPLVLLTLLSKCCEDCVRPPVRSLSEIECLFFVLTCIGRDLECHLPQQLEALLAAVRDAFLNSSASAPAIRRTLLQLIELQASRWQLPGNTVLYYYPSSK